MATERVRIIRGTRLDKGVQLKRIWLEATLSDCEPLTFADLKRTERFIIMPFPGDNSGHGGFLESNRLLIKISDWNRPLSVSANAICLSDGSSKHVSENELVYSIED